MKDLIAREKKKKIVGTYAHYLRFRFSDKSKILIKVKAGNSNIVFDHIFLRPCEDTLDSVPVQVPCPKFYFPNETNETKHR